MPPSPTLFTIGHSNLLQERFLTLLQEREITLLCDTRSQPYSRYVPHFNPSLLTTALESVNIAYLYLGQELGGRPPEPELYDEAGHVLYAALALTPRFLRGLETLRQKAESQNTAIFCSEEHPSHCHRRLLIGRVLHERGWKIVHIRADGRIQTEEELIQEEQREKNPEGQQMLFAPEEVTAWRSIQSVSRGKPQRSSLES